MPKTDFTPAELKEYFKKETPYEHHFAKESRERERDMRVHAEGTFPEILINERRPNEPETVLAYRKTIFVPKTKPYFSKIESTLQKIRRSSDWSIKYGEGSFDRVIEGEKLVDYMEHNYHIFGSVTNWAFSSLLRNYLIDANALCLVAPIEIPYEENQYLEPVCTIFNSCNVIDFVEDDYAVVRNKMGCTYYSGNRSMEGQSFYIITTVGIYRYDQLDGRGNYGITYEYEHGLEELPIFKLGGIVTDVYGYNSLYESRISGILPEFNEALREYSDLQAAKVLHLYPERWEYAQNECVKCKGSGQRIEQVDGSACQVECSTCHGVGYIATGPYSKMLIKPAAADQLALPTPPAGFVEKDVKIIEIQEAGVDAHIYNGLASINFEFLARTPLTQSGVAKEVDKDELNNTVHAIAEDMVRIIDTVYYLIALYRYSGQYDRDKIISMLPKISVPEKYDILSTQYYIEQIKAAIDTGLSPAITNPMQVSYATKAFNNDPEIAAHVGLLLQLDLLAGISEDDKMSRLSNNGITQLDYIISSNINKFVDLAIEANPGFVALDVTKQREIITAFAVAQEVAQTADLIPPDEQDIIPNN
jgi:hypothetical protein